MKRDQGFALIEILLIVAVVGVLGFTGWTYYQHTKLPPAASQSPQSNLKPETVTSTIKTELGHKYTLLDINTNNHPTAGQISIDVLAHSPAYQVKGYNFFNDYNGGSTINTLSPQPNGNAAGPIPNANDVTVRRLVQSMLSNWGLKQDSTRGNPQDGSAFNVWLGRGLICLVDPETSATSGTMTSCGELSAYPAAAATVQPLADAYPLRTASTIFDNPVIKDSSVKGYQQATAETGDVNGGGGSVALFYRQNSGTWKYFTNAQADVACSAYSTTDLKNAFKGTACFDAANNHATVQ